MLDLVILDDSSQIHFYKIQCKNIISMFLFLERFINQYCLGEDWWTKLSDRFNQKEEVYSFFFKQSFSFSEKCWLQGTQRGIKKEILCFKSGEESIIENGPGVLDFKGRNIAQNVLTFIFTPEKNPFRESFQLIKKNCSKSANIHSHPF